MAWQPADADLEGGGPVIISVDEAEIPPEPALTVCPLCGGAVVVRELEVRFPRSDPLVVVSNPLSGYRCRDCNAPYLDEGTSRAVFSEALDALSKEIARCEGPHRERAVGLRDALREKLKALD